MKNMIMCIEDTSLLKKIKEDSKQKLALQNVQEHGRDGRISIREKGMRRNNCKICGRYSGKSDTCKSCKERFPYKPNGKGANPFNRLEEYNKQKRREKKDEKYIIE